MTDISSIKAHDREVELTHPATEEGLGWFFQLRSPYSKEMRDAEKEIQNQRLNAMRRGKSNINADVLANHREKIILAGVSGWRFEGDASFEGDTPEFSKAKLREIVRNPDHAWIRDFLDRELGSQEDFFEN